MILKTSTLALILSFIWVNFVNGAPYSNVYVQRGPEVLPVEYFQYESPSFPIAGRQYAQLTAAPAESVVPVSSVSSYVSPCGSSCFYPGQGVAPISQYASVSGNPFIAYNSPISSLPVVVPREDTGYQYSYVVYDGHTGDHKAQREHSDGSVVRGEYSFIQPDGYVREVQYVADDLNGFNAVVKNYLPAGEIRIVEHIEKTIPALYNEVKNEPFIEQEIIEHNTHEADTELKSGSHHLESAHNEGEHHKHSVRVHQEHSEEPHHSESSHHSDSVGTETHHDHPKESHHVHEEMQHSDETQHGHTEGVSHIEVVEIVDCAHGETHQSHPEESHNAHLKEKEAESSDEVGDEVESEEELHNHSEHHQEIDEVAAHHGITKHHEHEAEAPHYEAEEAHLEDHHEHIEKSHHSHAKEHEGTSHGHSEGHIEAEERAHHGHTEIILIKEEDHPEHTETVHDAKHGESNTKVAYDEVIRCVQTAVDDANDASNAQKVDKSSPTYIILNKPC